MVCKTAHRINWPTPPLETETHGYKLAACICVGALFVAGLAIAWCGVCLGFGIAAGWAAWGAMW